VTSDSRQQTPRIHQKPADIRLSGAVRRTTVPRQRFGENIYVAESKQTVCRAGAAAGGVVGMEESRSSLAPVSMGFSMWWDTRVQSGRMEALEAALETAQRKVVEEFGGRYFRLERTRVGPSDDTLHLVLSFVVEHMDPHSASLCFQTCKPWKQELETLGFCQRTVQLCSALSQGHDLARLRRDAVRRLSASTGAGERASCLDVCTFMQRLLGWGGGSLHSCLQAASQEPAASFLSRGATSTAQIFGLPSGSLAGWVGQPHFVDTLEGSFVEVHREASRAFDLRNGRGVSDIIEYHIRDINEAKITIRSQMRERHATPAGQAEYYRRLLESLHPAADAEERSSWPFPPV